MKRTTWSLAWSSALALAAVGAAARAQEPAAETPLRVLCTQPALGSIAAQIGGDAVRVESIARPGADLHAVEAKPSLFAKLRDADALVHSGLDLELWVGGAIEGSRNARLRAGQPGNVDASAGVLLLQVPESPSRAEGDVHVFGNPHYWLDPLNGKAIAATLAARFALLRPREAAAFEARRKAFDADVNRRLREWLKLALPYKNAAIVTYHDAFPYFARRFGLRVAGTVEVKPRIAPTQAHLLELIRTMERENVRVVVREPFQDESATRFLAERTGATVLTLSTLPGFAAAGEIEQSYQELIDANLRALLAALPPPARDDGQG